MASKIMFPALQSGAFGGVAGEQMDAYFQQNFSIMPGDPTWQYYFAIRCAQIKIENPNIKTWELYWQAAEETVHIILDGLGFIPVGGEIADITNGLIYSLQGDGVNAIISYQAAIPIAGWWISGLRMASRLTKLADGSNTTYHWVKVLRDGNQVIHFGACNQTRFRKALGLKPGDPRVAHHVIPEHLWAAPLVQRAAQGVPGGKAFHIDEAFNGLPISYVQHQGNHGMPGGIYRPWVR